MKRKWQRSTGVKGILVVLSYIVVMFMAIYIVILLNVSHITDILDSPTQYTESAGFRDTLNSAVSQATRSVDNEMFLREDGEFNPDRLVDIEYYVRNSRISGVNESGVAYRLEDLLRWSNIFIEINEFGGFAVNTVVVAVKPDGTFRYYTPREFDVILNHEPRGGVISPQPIPLEEVRVRFDENEELILILSDGNRINTGIYFTEEEQTLISGIDVSLDEHGIIRVLLVDEDGNIMAEFSSIVHLPEYNSEISLPDESDAEAEWIVEISEDFIHPDPVLDSEGNILYTNWWHLEIIAEQFPPVGAESLLELANDNPNLNGRLAEISADLETVLWDLGHRFGDFPRHYRYEINLTEGNTNFIYLFVDEGNETVITNRLEYEDYDNVSQSIDSIINGENIKYIVLGENRADFVTNIEGLHEYQIANNLLMEDRVFIAAVDMGLTIHDAFYFGSQDFYNMFRPFIGSLLPLFFASGVILLVSIVWLTMVSGRKRIDDEVHLRPFDKMYTELSVGILVIPFIFLIIVMGWFGVLQQLLTDLTYLNISILFVGALVAIAWTFFIIGYLSLVKRIKAKILWQNSILRRLINALARTLRQLINAIAEIVGNIDIVWKSIVFIIGVILINWFFVAILHPISIPIILLINGGILYIVARLAIGRSRINTGVKEMASGDINYQIPLDNLIGDNLKTAELVNSIGEGLHHAVEEKMRSERMKTDLITNVSHDIKTPLTSIINYIDLLKREEFDDPKVNSYLEILEAKANQLKTLTEDVVEASKVSSGNVDLERMEINLVEMLHQAKGEFKERFTNRNLTMVSNIPDESILIYVDGKRMWRILENVYSNVVKYAMPGTRVYIDATKEMGQVTFSVKNISEHPLNISPDELTERFIRGDTARTTEGSGLGLSIAKSLTELQEGSFELYLDGDLFKVVISFGLVDTGLANRSDKESS